MQISKLVWRWRQHSCLVCADKSASLCRARRIVCRAVWLSGVADSLPAFSATHHFFTHSRPATHLVLDYFAQKILVQEYLCLLSDCMSMWGNVWFEFNRSQHGLWEKTYLVSSGLDTVWASTFWGFGSSIKSNHKPWITKKNSSISWNYLEKLQGDFWCANSLDSFQVLGCLFHALLLARLGPKDTVQQLSMAISH